MRTIHYENLDKIIKYNDMKYFHCILKYETVKILQTQFYDIYA